MVDVRQTTGMKGGHTGLKQKREKDLLYKYTDLIDFGKEVKKIRQTCNCRGDDVCVTDPMLYMDLSCVFKTMKSAWQR